MSAFVVQNHLNYSVGEEKTHLIGKDVVLDSWDEIETDLYVPFAINGKPVNTIGNFCFDDFSKLKNIHLPDTIKNINHNSFQNCASLMSVDFPEALEWIGNYAFYGCKSLKYVNIPPKVIFLNEGVFKDCINLRTVRLSENTAEIGYNAFQNCFSLETISIPSKIKYIHTKAFSGCENIKHVFFSEAFVTRPDADEIFAQMFEAGLRTREVLLRIPTL